MDSVTGARFALKKWVWGGTKPDRGDRLRRLNWRDETDR